MSVKQTEVTPRARPHLLLWLQIYDGDVGYSPQKGPYCGTQAPFDKIYSSSNLATVVFASDSSIEQSGFNITVSSVQRGVFYFKF